MFMHLLSLFYKHCACNVFVQTKTFLICHLHEYLNSHDVSWCGKFDRLYSLVVHAYSFGQHV